MSETVLINDETGAESGAVDNRVRNKLEYVAAYVVSRGAQVIEPPFQGRADRGYGSQESYELQRTCAADSVLVGVIDRYLQGGVRNCRLSVIDPTSADEEWSATGECVTFQAPSRDRQARWSTNIRGVSRAALEAESLDSRVEHIADAFINARTPVISMLPEATRVLFRRTAKIFGPFSS